MENRKLKKSVIYALYAFGFITIMGTVYLLDMISNKTRFTDNNTYVNKVILEYDTPVVNVEDSIIKPYLEESITIGRNFYDYQATSEEQQQSLIYYEGTYIPNTGVDYKSDEVFDVIAILDGEVTKVTENPILGKIVEITHNNNLISVYQSLNDIVVQEGDLIIQGQIIAKSGTSNISKDLNNHLHFEIIYNGKNINPEKCYDKKIDEL